MSVLQEKSTAKNWIRLVYRVFQTVCEGLKLNSLAVKPIKNLKEWYSSQI